MDQTSGSGTATLVSVSGQTPAVPDVSAPPTSYAWYALGILSAVYAVHVLDRSIINVLLEPIGREFRLNDSQLGLLTGVGYAVPFALASVPIGALIDRINRKRLLAGLLALWSGLTGLGGLAPKFGFLLLVRMGVGAAESGTPPCAMSLISDYFSSKTRPGAVSIYFLGAPLGAMLGSYLGGAITAAFGWRSALFVAAIPGFVLAVLLLISLREPERGRFEADTPRLPPLSNVIGFIGRERGFALIAGALVLAAMPNIGVPAWAPVVMIRIYHMPVQEAGLVMAFTLGFCGAIGSLLGGGLANFFAGGRSDRLILISGTATFLCAPLLAFSMLTTAQPIFISLFIAWSVVMMVYFGPAFGLALGLSPPRMRGRLSAIIYMGANVVGGGIAPQLIGIISDIFKTHGDERALAHAIACISVLSAFSAFLFLLAMYRLPRGIVRPLGQDEVVRQS